MIVTSSPSSSVFGQVVTFTATVGALRVAEPERQRGAVTFEEGAPLRVLAATCGAHLGESDL